MKMRIPLAKPEITDSDREAVLEVLRTPHLSSGPKVQEFEQAICEYTGSKYAVAVNSGTSALQIVVRALGLEPGAEVILPSFTFSALLNVVLQEGLQPKFVDIDPESYNTTPELVAAAITEDTQLVIAVHTFGIPADVPGIISAISSPSRAERPRHTIQVIEDACEALGAQVEGRKAGTLGDAGLFAFYPNKQITTGEGGVLVTSDERLARLARILRNQGRDPTLSWEDHAEIGFSYRLSDMNCALGISQRKRLEHVIEKRRRLAESYDRRLQGIADLVRPPLSSVIGRISWFAYAARLSDRFTRADRGWICESLGEKGIATGKYFAPLHRQPVLRKRGVSPQPELPNTEFVADRVIALPFFNELTDVEIEEVCRALEASIHGCRRKT
jgi:perosamine synthetase